MSLLHYFFLKIKQKFNCENLTLKKFSNNLTVEKFSKAQPKSEEEVESDDKI